jgi:Dolichyl-phosphate-mannose-protein mannosyltransferase
MQPQGLGDAKRTGGPPNYPHLLLALLIAIASLRIISTYFVFSNTTDEPAHIACGLEWLDRHTWTLEPLHPPLARVLTAVGPFLRGERSHPELGMWSEGFRILGSGRHYDLNLAAARLGILPLFWIAATAVYWWARRLMSPRGASFAALIFTTTPPVLAHAGLATTDFALVAFSATSVVAALYFLESRSSRRNTALRASLLGFSLGLAIASKFSALVFLPAILLALLIWRCLPNLRRPELTPLRTAAIWSPLIAFAAFATVWSIYRFSFSTDPVLGFSVPFPELFAGLRLLRAKNAFGSPAYLCGRCSLSGFWYYFPAVLSVKTPLGMLALVVLGICLGLRRDLRALLGPLLVVAAILIAAAFSRIDIGVRHLLAVYPALSVAAGFAMERTLNGAARRGLGLLAAAFLLWHLASGMIAHPDYFAYTNELALPTPENVLVDSDLDWGQDMKRLALRARQLGIREMASETMGGSYVLAGNAFPKPLPFDWRRPAPGWNAVSVTPWKLRCFYTKGYQRPTDLWPDKARPVEKIGKSTYLFYFPP